MAVGFEGAITLGVAVLTLVVLLGTLASIMGGGRRWRDRYESEDVAHKQTAEELAAARAIIEVKSQELAGMSDRLQRLDESHQRLTQTLADMGGSNVVDAIATLMERIDKLAERRANGH